MAIVRATVRTASPVAVCVAALLLVALLEGTTQAQDVTTLVQSNGCVACHGAAFKGTMMGPQLYGIERRRTMRQIAGAIAEPTAPMPKAPLTAIQVRAIALYLSALDGSGTPTAHLDPPSPISSAILTVVFPGPVPSNVVALPTMRMGGTSMNATPVPLQQTADPRVFRGTVSFSMAGPWTIDVLYDGKHFTVPVTVGSQ